MRKLFPLLIFSFFVSNVAHAQTTAFEFLRLDRSARTAALGGNSVSIGSDITSFFQNPAAINLQTDRMAAFSFQKNLLDINSGFVVYGQALRGIGNVAAGISFVNYGRGDAYDGEGNLTGSWGASDLAVQLGLSREFVFEDIGLFTAGASIKFIYSGIDIYSSTAAAIDAGVLLFIPGDAWQIGIALTNLGTQVSRYTDAQESLPIDLRVSATKRLEGLPLSLSVGFERLADTTPNFTDRFSNFIIGGEFILSEEVLLRLGYNNARRQGLRTDTALGLEGFSGGLGIKVDKFQFDYAFSSYGVLGGLHQLTVATAL
ncbi:MAG: type IX secretion system protein PorQ [Rhizobacter sp.]|nr:type IX secretion system protein PorQ [Chlorobiales bacterium]